MLNSIDKERDYHDSQLKIKTAKQMEQVIYDERHYERKLIKKLNRMVK
jgi:hypothetical protein